MIFLIDQLDAFMANFALEIVRLFHCGLLRVSSEWNDVNTIEANLLAV